MSNPNDPTTAGNGPDTPWEEAMSRDFDARVRDLHEAPFDFTSVQGKARKIRRNRRAAVAGGILGVAAVVTPFAVLSTNGDPQTKEPQFAPEPTETATVAPDDPALPDYVQGNTWHQADGDEVELPADDYDGAVLWDDHLVATRFDGEVYSIADVIAADGTVVRTFGTTGEVAVNEAGTTISWIDPASGDVMTAWDGDEVALGTVDLASAGEGIAYWASAVAGGPNCYEVEDGCTVFVNGGDGTVQSFDSHGVNDSPLEQYIEVQDVGGTVATVLTDVNPGETCSAVVDIDTGQTVQESCDYGLIEISPDGGSIAAPPGYFDGLGAGSISILDSATLEQTGTYGVEGGFIGTWAWAADGSLVFSAYDGATWHLFSMKIDGEITELTDPVKGGDTDNPFALVQH